MALGVFLLGLTLPLAAQCQRAVTRLRPSSGRITGAAAMLDTLTARPLLYAVGVAEDGGEILVFNGQAFTTRSRPDGATETSVGFQGRAAWLLQAQVTRWNDVGIVPATVTSPAELAQFIRQAVVRAGLEPRAWQSFQLLGEPAAVWWQVAAFPTASPIHSAAELGARGCFARSPMQLMGFLHPSPKRNKPAGLHLHVRPDAQPFVAHVDSLRPDTGLRLLLSALP